MTRLDSEAKIEQRLREARLKADRRLDDPAAYHHEAPSETTKPPQPKPSKKEQQRFLDEIEQEKLNQRIEEIMDTAMNRAKISKLLPDKYVLNAPRRREYAISAFKQNYAKLPPKHRTDVEIANIALLGVLSAYMTGAIRVVVRQEWGNLFAIPCYNPNVSQNYSVLADGDRIDFTYGDSLGLESEAIEQLIARGGILPGLIKLFVEEGYLNIDLSEKNKQDELNESRFHQLPKLMPPVKHIFDDDGE